MRDLIYRCLCFTFGKCGNSNLVFVSTTSSSDPYPIQNCAVIYRKLINNIYANQKLLYVNCSLVSLTPQPYKYGPATHNICLFVAAKKKSATDMRVIWCFTHHHHFYPPIFPFHFHTNLVAKWNLQDKKTKKKSKMWMC